MIEAIKNVVFGMIIGVANVIPGVSGGTMAVLLNIFDKLMNAFSIKNIKKNLVFLLELGLGAAVGIVLFSKGIKFLLESYPVATNFTFIGLIIGSLPMIYKRATRQTFRKTSLIPFFIALSVMVALSVVNGEAMSGQVFTQLTAGRFFLLIAWGAIAIVTMIIPGISGSLVLKVLGGYDTVIGAVAGLNLSDLPGSLNSLLLLLPFGIGCIAGALVGIKIIKTLIQKYEQPTYFAILGLIVGSPISMVRGFGFHTQGFIALGLMAVGAAVAYLFSVTEKESSC